MISKGTRVILTGKERRLLAELQYSKERTVYELTLLSGTKLTDGKIVFFYSENEFISTDLEGRGSVVLHKPLKCLAIFPKSGSAMYAKLAPNFCWENARSGYVMRTPQDYIPQTPREYVPQTSERMDAKVQFDKKQNSGQTIIVPEKIEDKGEEIREDKLFNEELEVYGGAFDAKAKEIEKNPHELCHVHEEVFEEKTPVHLRVPKEIPKEFGASQPQNEANDSGFSSECPLVPDMSDINPFADIFPGTKWNKVEFPASAGKWYYLRGEYFEEDKLKAVALAVPGTYSPRIPGFMSSSSKYYPVAGSGMGYWVSWQKLE